MSVVYCIFFAFPARQVNHKNEICLLVDALKMMIKYQFYNIIKQKDNETQYIQS